MIIKVQGTDKNVDSWRYYEAHEVQWCEMTYDDIADEMIQLANDDVMCEAFTHDEPKDSYMYARICFYDQDNFARHVYTYTKTYLLNNDGKTIDRIN